MKKVEFCRLGCQTRQNQQQSGSQTSSNALNVDGSLQYDQSIIIYEGCWANNDHWINSLEYDIRTNKFTVLGTSCSQPDKRPVQ